MSGVGQVEVIDSLSRVTAGEWNALLPDDQPFLTYEFLHALEHTGCVSEESGWIPQHLLLRGGDGGLLAAMPLYLKTHSWGEFVFDWAWADAYRRAGLEYYPKLLGAVPFTPATGYRMLAANDDGRAELAGALARVAATLGAELGVSSLHVLFPRKEELEHLRREGFMLRKDCQFQWRNRGYEDFDGFLASFTSKKRKNVRRERRRARETGLSFQWYRGDELGEALWHDVYAFHASTFLKRGHPPYLSAECFGLLGAALPERLLVLVVRDGARPVASAIFFRDANALYGRYWGCARAYHSLHFETCYYRGIDYCIEHGLQRFEPGTQGEHKLSRGFEPTATWSAHRIADPRFAAAIEDYLERELPHVDDYLRDAARHLPFRDPPPEDES